MNVLLLSLVSFGLAILAHLIVWRIHLPRRQTRSLLIILFGVSALVIGSTFPASRAGLIATVEYPALIQSALFCISMSLAYTITYSALEADSPTLVMIRAIADAGPEGFDKERLFQTMTGDVLVMPRIDDLLRLHRQKDGKLGKEPLRITIWVERDPSLVRPVHRLERYRIDSLVRVFARVAQWDRDCVGGALCFGYYWLWCIRH